MRLCAFAKETTPPRAATFRIGLSTTISLYLSALSAKHKETRGVPILSQHLVRGVPRYSYSLPFHPGRRRDSPGWRSVSRPHASSHRPRPVERLRPHLPGVNEACLCTRTGWWVREGPSGRVQPLASDLILLATNDFARGGSRQEEPRDACGSVTEQGNHH